MGRTANSLLTALLPVLFQACAVQQHEVNTLAEQLDDSTPESILLSLQSIDPPQRDRGQYLLNTGLLKSITGDFEDAIRDLQKAKKILNNLQAISVTESLAAATINETLRSYDASPSERVLLHVLLSIDYLMLNDLDAARVEVLQADVVMNELAREDVPIGQLASAHYIAGLVYELGGELDDARISYRKALNLMALRDMPPPSSLKRSLRKLNRRLGAGGNSGKYSARYFLAIDPPDPDAAEITVIYWDGVVTSKQGQHPPTGMLTGRAGYWTLHFAGLPGVRMAGRSLAHGGLRHPWMPELAPVLSARIGQHRTTRSHVSISNG